MTTILKFRCLDCVHYFDELKCTAFPEGIPEQIVFGEHKHNKPLNEQGNDIIYERDPSK